MRVRKARQRDFAKVIALAKKYGLDYSDMEADRFWVADEKSQILGIVGLKRHVDCLELCSLGVDERFRNRGIGEKLVLALLAEAKAEVHLATIIPGYFEKFGFAPADHIPSSMIKKLEWCEGCSKELCVVMVRKGL